MPVVVKIPEATFVVATTSTPIIGINIENDMFIKTITTPSKSLDPIPTVLK